MKKTITLGALALGGLLMASTSANALPSLFYDVGSDTFDFATLANDEDAAFTDIGFTTGADTISGSKDERAAEIAFKGATIWLVVSAAIDGTPADVYMDSFSGGKPAGLGVCSEEASGDCGSGDNVTGGAGGDERLIFSAYALDDTDFSDKLAFSLTGLQFRDTDHNPLDKSSGLFDLTDGSDGTASASPTFASATQSAIYFSDPDTKQIGFRFKDTQFYIESAVVPVPAALPIMVAALAGFGFAGYRSRRNG